MNPVQSILFIVTTGSAYHEIQKPTTYNNILFIVPTGSTLVIIMHQLLQCQNHQEIRAKWRVKKSQVGRSP